MICTKSTFATGASRTSSYPFRFAATSQSKVAFDVPPRSSRTVKLVAVFSAAYIPLHSLVSVTGTRPGAFHQRNTSGR